MNLYMFENDFIPELGPNMQVLAYIHVCILHTAEINVRNDCLVSKGNRKMKYMHPTWVYI